LTYRYGHHFQEEYSPHSSSSPDGTGLIPQLPEEPLMMYCGTLGFREIYGMTSLLNFMKIYHLVQKLLVGYV
jgi:hypothetical protein